MYLSISVYLQYISKNAVTSCACVSETMHANISVHLTIIYLISSMSDVWFGLTPPTPPWPPRAQCISVNLGRNISSISCIHVSMHMITRVAFMSPCALMLYACSMHAMAANCGMCWCSGQWGNTSAKFEKLLEASTPANLFSCNDFVQSLKWKKYGIKHKLCMLTRGLGLDNHLLTLFVWHHN